MVKLRKGVSYRFLERPYTRKSKYRKLNYVRASPTSKIVRYDMGNLSKQFPFQLDVLAMDSLQLRHNALESARLTCNRSLEKNLGKFGFYLKLRVYPHHILRENPLATGAGADRLSTGMARAFGKPVGIAARVKKGQTIFSVRVEKQHADIAKKALEKIKHKIPCSCRIVEVTV